LVTFELFVALNLAEWCTNCIILVRWSSSNIFESHVQSASQIRYRIDNRIICRRL